MLLIFFTIIFFINFFFQYVTTRQGKILIAIFSVTILYIFMLGVNETADYEGYVYIFENPEANTDFLFRFLADLFKSFGLTFLDLYKLHILLYGVLFTYFITRFTNNAFLVIIFYITILYIPLINQIRYYLAFGFLLNALYFLYFTRNRFITILFIVLSIFSHSAITLFYGFVLLNKYSTKQNYLKRCILLSVMFFVIMLTLNSFPIINYLGNYIEYLKAEGISSFAGGVYNILPYGILLLLLNSHAIRIEKRYPKLSHDNAFQILYKLSLYSIIFIPVSINIQIFAHRYVYASLIIWLCFYCYTITLEKSYKIISNYVVIITMIIIGLFYYTFFLPEIVLNETSYLSQLIVSFNSIDYLPNIDIK